MVSKSKIELCHTVPEENVIDFFFHWSAIRRRTTSKHFRDMVAHGF
jgi:PAS domain-containing protein